LFDRRRVEFTAKLILIFLRGANLRGQTGDFLASGAVGALGAVSVEREEHEGGKRKNPYETSAGDEAPIVLKRRSGEIESSLHFLFLISLIANSSHEILASPRRLE